MGNYPRMKLNLKVFEIRYFQRFPLIGGPFFSDPESGSGSGF